MYKKSPIIIALAAVLAAAGVGQAYAAFVGLPKSLMGPLAGTQLSMPLWGPMAPSDYCATNLGQCQFKKASLFSAPKELKRQLDRLELDTPVLAPMAHSVFCIQNPNDCKVKKIAFRGRKLDMTPKRWNDLMQVNAKVNRGIRPERNTLGYAGEKWLIAPKAGDCNDYAVTKRHELLARGWPSHTLLLAEVVTSWGEHHLILVARTGEGDLVLDNMSGSIRPWSKVPYRWVRMQSPQNPKFWSKVRSVGV